MPSTLKRTQQRALTLSRSFANAVRSTISNTLCVISPDIVCLTPQSDPTSFCDTRHPACSPFDNTIRYPTIPKHDIGRPRQLRRGGLPAFRPIHFIHRLPVEILSHIFVMGSEDDMMLPIRVSHVCRVWREITFRTPSLWRRITLTPQTEMWRERIYRARECTLDIQLKSWVTSSSGFPRHQSLDMYAVQWHIHLVAPFVRRWRSLEIVFTEYAPFLWNAALSGCCSRSRDHAKNLEDLTLIFRANDDTKEFCLFSGVAPKLRRVTLDGIRLTWLPSLFGNLVYLDYTHHGFTVGHQAVRDVMSMLEVCTRLVEFRILFPRKHIPVHPTRYHPVKRHVVLPFLTRLQLRVEGPDIPFELAHLMTLVLTPSLLSLRLIDAERHHQPFPSLKSFFYVYAIAPSLRLLRIEHGWYDPRMVTPVLQALPNIRQLVVRRPHSPDQILNLNPRSRKGRHWGNDVYGHMHFHVHPDLKGIRKDSYA